MRLIDVDNLIDDCKRYLATLIPDRDGKECTRIRWLIGVLDNAPSVNPDTPTDCISRRATIDKKVLLEDWTGKEYEAILVEDIKHLPSAQPEIIRCKDCKFYSPMNRETKTGICNLIMHQNFGDDWFCAGAERRTNG